MVCFGATYNSDGSMSNIQFIHDNDVIDGNGDTVTVPAGSFSWTDLAGGLILTKAMRLQGAGSGSTTITIDDEDPASRSVVTLDTPFDGTIEMDGFSFMTGTGTNGTISHAFMFKGTGYVYIHDNFFDALPISPNIWVGDACWGVMKDCNFLVGSRTTIWLRNGDILRDGSGSSGDETWLQAADFGGTNAFYLEDCQFVASRDANDNVTDWYDGAQAVVRYCIFDGTHASSHGTGDGSGRGRGPRKREHYGNTFKRTTHSKENLNIRNRGGPEIVYNNIVENYTASALWVGSYYRYRSPHGKFLQFPSYGADQWTILESGNSSNQEATTDITLIDTVAGWTSSEHIDNILVATIPASYLQTGASTISSIDVGTDQIHFTAAHNFTAGDHVYLRIADDANSPAPIDGWEAGNSYPATETGDQSSSLFVIEVDADTIQVALYPGGPALNITTAGSTTMTIEHLGQQAAVHRYDFLTSPISANSTTALTGEAGQQAWWFSQQWYRSGMNYQIVYPDLGWDMPGAGRCYATPGTYTWRAGQPGENTSVAQIADNFTTNFSADANQITLAINGEQPFDVGEIVQFTTTGTLPNPLAADTDYWVTESNLNSGATLETIEVSATDGGAPVTFTTNGTGTHTVTMMLRQELEGCYVWGNDYGSGGGANSDTGVIQDVHWFEENPNYVSGGGASGIGVGTLAARPVTPALVNSAYFANDQGADQDETAGPDGILYRWIDNNGDGIGDEWAQWWTPAAYPHFLAAGGGPAPDVDPPTPSPMTFAVNPAAGGPSSVTLTGTTATDATPPVTYRVRYIDQVTLSTTQTSWQTSASFAIGGLTPDRQYSFEIQARDAVATPNVTAYSTALLATTNTASTSPTATAGSATAGSVTVGP